MKKLLVIIAAGLLLGACSLINKGAWQGSRPLDKTAAPESATSVAPTTGPTETLEELDEAISADLDASLDADFKDIDNELNALEKDLQNY